MFILPSKKPTKDVKNDRDSDGVILGVFVGGYIISAIIFSIWLVNVSGLPGVGIKWGIILAFAVPFGIFYQLEKFLEIDYDITKEWGNIIDFEGKIGRTSFWLFFLFTVLHGEIALVILDYFISEAVSYPYSSLLNYSNIFLCFSIIPVLSLGSKRLHDTGRSGWWQLLYLTIIGIIVLIIFWSQKSKNIEKDPKVSNVKPENVIDELNKLNQLHKEGILSDGEFKKAKEKLLR